MKQIRNILGILLCTIVLFNSNSKAQLNCVTALTEDQIKYMNSTQQEREIINTIFFEQDVIPIAISAHIIRDSLGQKGLSEDHLITSIQQLNEIYQQVGFEFSLYSLNYINNNNFCIDLSKSFSYDSPEYNMAIPSLVPNTINVFYLPNSQGNWASFPAHKNTFNKDWIVINKAYSTDAKTLSHQIGHYFNLYHTHEDALGNELVDRSNCKTAGDELCDTPAEPSINRLGKIGLHGCIDILCKYACNGKDENDEKYKPNSNNLMSYALTTCTNSFTPEQITRMQQSYLFDRIELHTINDTLVSNLCKINDREALIAFYKASNGPNWKNTWDLNTDYKNWYGVITNDTGCVKDLDLEYNNLTGVISPEIGKLAFLEVLNLAHNKLTGVIPAEIEMLKNLKALVFEDNEISGSLPEEIGQLKQLKALKAQANQLSGTFPRVLLLLPNLCFLNITDNNFEGCYEPELKALCNNFWLPTNDIISSGNNFTDNWGEFCYNGAGTCQQKDFTFRFNLSEHIGIPPANKYTFDVFLDYFENDIADVQGIAGNINFGNLTVVRPRIRFFDSNFEPSTIIHSFDSLKNRLNIPFTCVNNLNLKPNHPVAELSFIVNEEDNKKDDYIIEFAKFITINTQGVLSQGLNSSYTLTELLPNLKTTIGMSNTLSQNKPNPFTEQTTINYVIPQAAQKAQLNLYTLAGTLVQTTAIEHTGEGSILIDTNNLKAGLYMYTLVIDGKPSTSKKMIVQK